MCLFFIQQASFFQIYITNHEQSFEFVFFYTNLNENCCDTVLSIRFLEDPIFGYNSNTFFNLFKNFTIHEVTQRHPIWSSNKTAKLKSFSVFLSDMNYPHSTRVRGVGKEGKRRGWRNNKMRPISFIIFRTRWDISFTADDLIWYIFFFQQKNIHLRTRWFDSYWGGMLQ